MFISLIFFELMTLEMSGKTKNIYIFVKGKNYDLNIFQC